MTTKTTDQQQPPDGGDNPQELLDLSGGDDGVSTIGNEDDINAEAIAALAEKTDENPDGDANKPAADGGAGSGNDGEQQDDAQAKEQQDAMAAGWKSARGDSRHPTSDEAKQPGDDGSDDATQQRQQTTDDDPEVPGLGMKASEVKAQLARLASVEKSVASAHGSLGHLKSQLTKTGGKEITKEAFAKVGEDYGEDFAEAIVEGLKAAGVGAGVAASPEAINAAVTEQVNALREDMTRTYERKLVLSKHADADDHFAQPVMENGKVKMDANGQPVMNRGKHNAEFLKFVGQLPADRQQELATTWDSAVISRALDEFKATKEKVAKQQTTQRNRLHQGALPTGSRGGPVVAPAIDPMKAGWNRAKGIRATA